MMVIIQTFALPMSARQVDGLLPDTLKVYFKTCQYDLDLGYKDNSLAVDRFVSQLCRFADAPVGNLRLIIYSGASPEGSPEFNRRLCEKRGAALRRLLASRLDDAGLPELVGRMSEVNVGARWDEVRRLVAVDNGSWRDEILAVLDRPVGDIGIWSVDPRETVLRRLHGGKVWGVIRDRYLPPLRNVCTVVVASDSLKSSSTIAPPQVPADSVVVTASLAHADTVDAVVCPVAEDTGTGQPYSPRVINFSTNLLYDLLLLPSVGVEIPLSDRWSVAANGTFNWLSNKSKHRYWRIGTIDVEGRYWLGKSGSNSLLRGHHVGAYVAVYRYDIEFGAKGQMADFNYGAGLSYGYAVPIGRSWSLDFSLGVGYIGGKYKEYEPSDDEYEHYVWQSDKDRTWVGPTKAEVKLVWHINLHRKGKGGAAR